MVITLWATLEIHNFPNLQVRARLAGVCMAFSFFCSAMTVLFYAPIANQFGEHVVFYIFATVTLLGTIYTVLWVPETKGKTLQEIQEYWKKPEPVFVWYLSSIMHLCLYILRYSYVINEIIMFFVYFYAILAIPYCLFVTLLRKFSVNSKWH